MKVLGVALVILGIVAIAYGWIGYDRKTTILQVGEIEAKATEHKTSPIAAGAGVVALLGGLAILIGRGRRLG